ncbi:MAG: glycosyltransferase family 2 protein [Sphingobacteriaceae bacterium]|nr:MAG: glycosyltransferase [Pedobacter sp.]
MSHSSKQISIVIPAFNESKNIKLLVDRIDDVFEHLSYQYEILLVNDGSSDTTQKVLVELSQINPKVHYVEFSRNFGKDAALKAGIDLSQSNAVITIDADLQHPPELIPQMINRWEAGYEVVYAYRKEANPHYSWFNKMASRSFYHLINQLSDIDIENGISDFRMMDQKVITVLKSINEFEIFLRGMVKWVGFKQIGIEYTPAERLYGNSTYSTKALIKLALQGITSFSIKPLYTAVYLGFLFSVLSLLYIPYVIYSFYIGAEVHGWASVIMTIVFFGGLQLVILGIIGIYIGKLFLQSKQRPNYIIRNTSLKGSQ